MTPALAVEVTESRGRDYGVPALALAFAVMQTNYEECTVTHAARYK